MAINGGTVQLIVFEWYDGPAAGALIDLGSLRCFHFCLIDWDLAHRIRVFALYELPGTVLQTLERWASATPCATVVFPPEFVHASDESQEAISAIEGAIIRPDIADFVLVWDNIENAPLRIQELPEERGRMAVSWFDASDTVEGAPDWFGYLAIPR